VFLRDYQGATAPTAFIPKEPPKTATINKEKGRIPQTIHTRICKKKHAPPNDNACF
jgi:hypothetical protein